MASSTIQKMSDKLFQRGLVIRAATTEDLVQLTKLVAKLFKIESDYEPNRRKQRQGLASLMGNNKSTVLVAVMQNEIIGMCTLQPLISTAEGGTVGMVEDLVVAESWRGKGMGTLLLDAIEELAGEQGMSRLQLLAGRGNEQAQFFYDKQGWDKTNMRVRRKKL